MVNPDVDSYAKALNHRKMIWKTQKTTTYWILKPKYHLKVAVRFSDLDCHLPGGKIAPLPPVSYVTGYDILF